MAGVHDRSDDGRSRGRGRELDGGATPSGMTSTLPAPHPSPSRRPPRAQSGHFLASLDAAVVGLVEAEKQVGREGVDVEGMAQPG